MKQKENTRKYKRLREPSFMGMLAMLFFGSGAIFAFLMSLTPLKNHAASSQLPDSPRSLTGIIPDHSPTCHQYFDSGDR